MPEETVGSGPAVRSEAGAPPVSPPIAGANGGVTNGNASEAAPHPNRFDRILDADGLLDLAAFQRLEDELIQEKRWNELTELYELAAERAPDGDTGRGLMLNAGLLIFEKLGDARRAEAWFRRVLASDAEHVPALDAYRQLCASRGRFDEAADLLDAAIASADPVEKPALSIELAEIAATKLGQVDRAAAALRYAYELDPSRVDVLERARKIFLAERRVHEAKAVLDAEAQARFGASGVPSEPSDASRAVGDAYRELAVALLDTPLEHTLAEECLAKARALGDADALARLDDLAALRREWEARAKSLRDEAMDARDKRKAAELYVRVAELFLVFGQDALKSDENLKRALLLVPGLPAAVDLVERTYRKQGRTKELAARLGQIAAEVKDKDAKKSVLLRAARAAEDPAAAAEAYEKALEVDPGQKDAALTLSVLLGESGDVAGRAKILEAYLAAADQDHAKIAVHLELGATYAQSLGDTPAARRHFEAVLALDPTNFHAASALRALYTDLNDPAHLLGVLRILAGYSPDLFSRLDLLTQIAQVADKVGPEDAFQAYLQIFEIDANAGGVEKRLDALSVQLGRADVFAEALARASEHQSGARAVDLALGAARAFDQKLGRPVDAIRAYKRALALAPGRDDVRDALERLLRERDDPQAVVDMLESQLARTTEPQAQAALLAKLAGTLDRDLQAPGRAATVYRRLLEVDPKNAAALEALDAVYTRLGEGTSLAEILALREGLAETPRERAEIARRRGKVLDEQLGNKDAAAQAYLAALSELPDDAELIASLLRVQSQGAARVEIARALEPLMEQRGHHVRRAEMLDILSAGAADPKEGAELSFQSGQLVAEKAQDLPAALERYGRALQLAPAEPRYLDALIAVAVQGSLQSRAVEILAPIVNAEVLPPQAASTYASALARLDEDLDRPDDAIAAYQRAIRADGGNQEAVIALERLLGARERWADLAKLFEERLSFTPDAAARARLGVRIAAIKDERLGDLDGAIASVKRVLEIAPNDLEALSRLASAYERKGRLQELLEVVDRMRAATPDNALKAALDVRAAQVLFAEAGEAQKALERYKRALELRPDAPGAHEGLEALLARAETRAAAAALLEPYYANEGRNRDLVGVLRARLEAAKDGVRRDLYFRIADLEQKQLGQADAAFETMAAAFKEGMLGPGEKDQLMGLALAANQGPALAELFEEAAARTGDLDLLRELGRLYDGVALDTQKSQKVWNQILEKHPQDVEALEALERLHGAGEDPRALAEVLLARADAAPDDASRLAFLKRAAAIYEEAVEEPGRAAQVLEQCRKLAPRDRNTLEELGRLYTRMAKLEPIAGILAAEAELVEDLDEKAQIQTRLGRVLVELQRPVEAVAAYKAALDARPKLAAARQGIEGLESGPAAYAAAMALEPIYRAEGDWARLVAAYEKLAQGTNDRAERVERLVAIRSIYEDRLGSLDRAFAAAQRAYKDAPEDEDVLAALERLARKTGGAEEYVGLLEDRADETPRGSKERYAARLRAARFLESAGADRATTLAAWRRLLDGWPRDVEGLEAVARISKEAGDAPGQLKALLTLADVLPEPKEKAERLRAAARIFEAHDKAKAVELYERALSHDPSDADALARLDVLYASAGRHGDLERILIQGINRSPAGPERATLWLRLGRLRAGPLGDPRAGVEALRTVLDARGEGSDVVFESAADSLDQLADALKGTDPDTAALAAELVEPYWIRAGEHLKVVGTKEVRVAAEPNAEKRAALLREIAETYEKQLEQPEMAFLALARAYTPGDEGIGAELERLSKLADSREELAEVYARAIPQIDDESKALSLSRRVAHLYDVELRRGELAVPYYERVLGASPGELPIIEALERIHGETGNARGLVQIYRIKLGLRTTAEPDKRKLLAEIARLSESALGDADAAFEAYRTRIAMDNTDLAALKDMAELAEREGRTAELVEALSTHASLTSNKNQKADLLLHLGGVKRARLADELGAVEAFAEVLQLRPQDPNAIAHLASLTREEGVAKPVAAKTLAPVFFASGAFSDYIACLEIQLQARPDPATKKDLYLRIAETYEKELNRPEHAFTYACRALHEDIRDGAVRARVERIAHTHGLLEDLAGFYLDEVDTAGDHALALAIRRRVAEIYDHEIGDVDRAIIEHQKVLDLAPGDLEALKSLERLFRQSENFPALAEIYRRRIASAEDNDTRATLFREFARLQAEHLNDPSGAVASLRRLLEIAPRDLDALTRLAALCESMGRNPEHADTLERMIVAAEDVKTQQAARLALARVKAEKLGDRAGAAQILRGLLQGDPRHPGAREYLRTRLEEALAEDDGRTALESAELLSEAMRAAGEYQALIEVQRVRVNLSGDVRARAAVNREIAAIYRDKIHQPELAFAALTQAFRDAPEDEEVRADLEQLAETLLLLDDLVDVLEAALEDIVDPEARFAMEVRIAQLLETKVGDKARAAAAWERVLARRPMDEAATEALDRLNVALGRWAALTEILEKRIELTQDKALAHQLFVRLGAVWEERLDEPREALDAFRKARQLEPADKGTLRALVRLLSEEDHADELASVLNDLAQVSGDGGELVIVLPRLAKLMAGRYQRRADAIELWRRVLSIDPTQQEAVLELERLYEIEARWQDLGELLEKQLRTARDEREVTRLQRRLALIKGTRLGNVDEAVRSWVEILRKNPHDLEALEALRKIYRSAGRWGELVATLRKLIPLQADADGVKSIRFELAEVFLQHLDRKDEAIESAKRVLDVEPHTMVELARLEELLMAAGAFTDAVRVMNQLVEMADLPGEKIDVLFRIAQTYEQKMNRRAGATSAYERVLGLEPENPKAYDALAAIYESGGEYRKLVELHNRRLDALEDPDERRRLLFEIIDIQERRLGHKDLAFPAACRAFHEEGADPKAQAIAERLAEETGSWEILVEVFEEQVDQVPLDRAIELRRRLAEIYLDKLEEPVRAERQLDLVLSLRPEDDGARAQMARLLESQSRWRDLVEVTIERAERAPDPETKKVHLRRVAEIEDKSLHEPDTAIASLRRLLALDPGDKPALLDLARLLRATEQWQPLIDTLERLAQLSENEREQAERQFEIAQVWDECIEDAERAIINYRHVLATDPTFTPALKALEHLYAEARRFSDLVDVYDRQVLLSQKPEEQIVLLTKIASIQEDEFGDNERAAATLIRLLEVDPAHLATVRSLERVWRETREWSKLIEAKKRHIELTKDREEIVSLDLEIAEIYASELEKADRAEEYYQSALHVDSRCRPALRGLADLYERAGNWFNTLEMLKREAGLLKDTPAAVELWARMGRIHEQMLMDRDAAKVAFHKALEIDPAYKPAIEALEEIDREEDNWEDVLQIEAQAADHTEDEQEKAERYQKAAETAVEKLELVDDGIRLYEKSLAAVPDHIPSVRALADLYFVKESFEKSERLLERLVDRLDRREDKDELVRQYYRLAYISEKLGDDEQALKRYLASYELDPAYLPTLEGLGGALLRAERWDDAQRVFQTILVHHRDSLTDAEVVDVHYELGELAIKLDQTERARKAFDKALDLDPNHPNTLRAYAELSEQLEEWEEAYDHRARLIDLLDGDDRFDAVVKQARLSKGPLDDPYRAIDAYSEARRMRPDDEDVLYSIARLYRETGQHPRAIEAYEDLAQVLTDTARKRDIYLELAGVHWEEKRDWARSVEALNNALDLDPKCVTAFERIETILPTVKQWTALEENYRRMIERLPKDASSKAPRVVLWKSLGELYRKVLKNDEGAKTAYQVVLKLKPEEHDVALTLAELLGSRRETAGEALKIYHSLVPVVADPSVPVRALFGLYHALGLRDRALCAVSALVLMRSANADEQKIHQLLLKAAPQMPTRAITDALWHGHLLHPDCRGSLAEVLSVLYRGAPDLFGDQQRSLLLKKKEKVEITEKGKGAREGLLAMSLWRQIFPLMGVPAMVHYHRPGSASPPRLYPGEEAALVVGEQHEVFREMPPKHITWLLARQMACARPELAPARALLPVEVAAAIEGAIRMFAPTGSGVKLEVDERLVGDWNRWLLKNLSEVAMKTLRVPVEACVARRDLKNLAKFLEGVEHTASRAALLIANDVRVADKALADPDVIVEVSHRRRARELMLFCLSEDHFILRERLGLAIPKA